jgi:hypothetical protein
VRMLEKLLLQKQTKIKYYLGQVPPAMRKAWLEDPVTKSFIARMEYRLLSYLNMIQMGEMDRNSLEEVALTVAGFKARSQELEDLIEELKGIAQDDIIETSGTSDSSEAGPSGENE